MPTTPPITYLSIWYRALEAEIGIAFTISGVRREYFRNTLYECRKQAADPRLDEIIIFLPTAGHENEIWLCRKQVELDE